MENIMEQIYVGNIAVCAILGIVLLFTKTPQNPDNHNYIIAKRVIAVAVFLVAIGVAANLIIGDFNESNSRVERLNLITLIIFNVQIGVLTFTLMALYNSQLVSRKNIYTLFIPFSALLVAYAIAFMIDGDVLIFSHEAYFALLAQKPALMIRTLLLIWALISMGICICWFYKAQQEFNKAIDNYFDGSKVLHTQWVSHIFYIALSLSGLTIVSYIVTIPYWDAYAITGITLLFTIITIQFLNYPHILATISSAIEYAPETAISAIQRKSLEEKLNTWKNLPSKPYTRSGITVSDLADDIKDNKRAISSYLNSTCNTNFNTWINTLRIDEAMRLIEEDRLLLYEIAEHTGFSDLAKLSNCMKKYTGECPSEYRKKHCKK